MMKMMKRTLLTFLVFFVLNCIVWTIASLIGVIPEKTVNPILIIVIIYSVCYLIDIFVYTRKHETLSRLLFLAILLCALLFIVKPKTTDIIQDTNKLANGVQFIIGFIIIVLESYVAERHAREYKIEKQIRKEENERVKVLFEELDAHGNVTRKGKAKLR